MDTLFDIAAVLDVPPYIFLAFEDFQSNTPLQAAKTQNIQVAALSGFFDGF